MDAPSTSADAAWRSMSRRSTCACWGTCTPPCGAMPHRREALATAILAACAIGHVDAAVRDEPSGGTLFDLGTVTNRKEPITVSADTLEYDYKNNVVVYRGDVQAAQGQVKLRSDTLTVTFESVKNGTQPTAADPPVPDPAAKGS